MLYYEQLFFLHQETFIDKHACSQKRKTPDLSSACASLFVSITVLTIIVIDILTSKYAYLNIVYFSLAYI